MPVATTDGITLFYDTAGSGETVAFVGEAGYGAWQWGWQHDRVAGPFEALVCDLRGTGRSDAPPGPYTVEAMAADLEAVLADAAADRVHLVGAGLGGMVALRYARAYTRARTLTLFGTAPDGSALNESALRALHATGDDREVLRASLAGAFSEEFLAARDILEQICDWRASEDADADGFEAQVCAALAFEADWLYELTLPALVCHGRDDPVVAHDVGRALAAELPRGVFETVEGRHLAHIEHSRAVTDRLLGFLSEHSSR